LVGCGGARFLPIPGFRKLYIRPLPLLCGLAKELKELRRTIALELWGNRYAVKALEEISRAYREMLVELVGYAVRYKASLKTLHRMFYNKYRSRYPWLPTRVVKGCMRDALRIAKSFRRIKTRQYTWEIAREIIGFLGLNPKRKGDRKVIKEIWDVVYRTAREIAIYQLEREIKSGLRPEIKSITIHYSDSQDWRLEDGVIKVRTHIGWAELHYRGNRHLWGYLYGGWELSKELRIKVDGGKIIAYLVFEKVVEVGYDPDNVVAVDINEDNVTAAVFVKGTLVGFVRIETNLGRIAIAYSERRKRISQGRSTRSDRAVKKALKKLREEGRKEDIVYKTARVIEDLAIEYSARVVVGDVYKDKDKILERVSDNRMRHRIAQWSASKLAKILGQKPIHVESIYEGDTSSKDPFDQSKELSYTPAVIRVAMVSGGLRVRVIKIRFRLARLSNGWILDRDMVGALNIGLRALASDGSPMALGSTEPHAVWAKLVNPHRGLAQAMELKIFKSA